MYAKTQTITAPAKGTKITPLVIRAIISARERGGHPRMLVNNDVLILIHRPKTD